MWPELFEIPFIHLTVKSYGLMMVIGFLAAIFIIRHLSRNITPNPQLVTNAALYSLIAGVVGARLFYVVHHFDQFQESWISVFAIWKGGLELLGGVLLAIAVIVLYLWYYNLPIRRYLDILAIGLMLALAFGRIGCFLNGCCFGKPTNLTWAVRFPYDSFAYRSQINPNLARNRPDPQLQLSPEFISYMGKNATRYPKPYENLTESQKQTLKENNKLRSLPVHPTQLYSSANGAVLCLILYLLWRRTKKAGLHKTANRPFVKPGYTFSLMFILYGITRFYLEFLRDDNPFEYGWWIIYKGATVSQNLGIYLTILGLVLMAIFAAMKPDKQ